LLASVLKPCNDTRMYEKFGLSLTKKGEMFIFGRASPTAQIQSVDKNATISNRIGFYDSLRGEATKAKRIIAWFKFAALCFKIKPDIIVTHCPELLPILAFYRLFSKCKMVYDVRENYYYNILYQNNYKGLFKRVLAGVLRLLEQGSKLYIDAYLLAEQCYNQEFVFHKKKFEIIENKYAEVEIQHNQSNLKSPSAFNFVYTGTISGVNGIWQAIKLIQKMYAVEQKVHLKVIGHIVSNELRKNLQAYLADKPYIELVAGSPLVAHKKIVAAILESDFVMLPYRSNKSTASCIPTKLYECLALRKPMLIQDNLLWQKKCEPYNAAVFIDYEKEKPKNVLGLLKSTKFYTRLPKEEVLWQSEEKKLYDFISEL